MRGGKRFRPFAVVARHRSRRGLTLIEVMLVLAIMVVIASFTFPAISGVLVNQRLKKGADVVRTQWSKSRVMAMSSGHVVLFRYEIGGNHFRLDEYIDVTSFENETYDGSMPESTSTDGGDAWTPYSESGSKNAVYASGKALPSLPEGVLFRECQIENDSRSTTAAVTSDDPSGASWSAPIYFYPDGTSSSARLQIYNDRQRAIEITLRGLTGVAKVSDIFAEGGSP
jgi:prepilin-type N-terminal cleavage/methylation domain-containing protein